MRILHTVEFYHPSMGGAQEVVRQLSERMVELGHDVTVATSRLPERTSNLHRGVKIIDFDIAGNQVRGYTGDIDAYTRYIKDSDFNVIMNYAAQQWTSDLVFPSLKEISAHKVFVPCGFSGLHEPAYTQYFRGMPNILKQYDATVYLSHDYRDINFAREHGVENMHVIPNGADEKEFLHHYDGNIRKELKIAETSKLIVHIGGFTGVKGQTEAIEIFEKANLANSTLLLIGNVFDQAFAKKIRRRAVRFNLRYSNLRNKTKVLVMQLSRVKTVAALQSADLFLFPSNIEASPLVLFEACAAKTPFLTTDVGNSKEIIRWTGGGRILPTRHDAHGYSRAEIEGSAKLLEVTINDQADLMKMAKAGYHAWDSKYRWDKIAGQYLKLYKGGLK